MNSFSGVVYPRLDLYVPDKWQSDRLVVTVEFAREFVILKASENEMLGRWKASEMLSLHVNGSRFGLTVRGTHAILEVDQPVELLEDLASAEATEKRDSQWTRFTDLTRRKASKLMPTAVPSEVFEVGSLHAENLSEVARVTTDADPHTFDSTGSESCVQAEAAIYRIDVVEWLEAGMAAWFQFYFRLSLDGLTVLLEQTASDMEYAALQLRSVSEQLEELSLANGDLGALSHYASGVGVWAAALDQIALGCRMDQHKLALEGFTIMNRGTSAIEELIKNMPRIPRLDVVTKALAHLDALTPEPPVADRSVAQAKTPWRRALLAAGWSRTDSGIGASLMSKMNRLKSDSTIWDSLRQ